MHKIGHEVGNPLTSIISMGTVLTTICSTGSAPDIAEKAAKYSGSIIDEAWRISRLNERIVMLLSDRTGNAASCDLQNISKKALSKLRSRYKRLFKDIRLEFEGDDPQPKPYIDEMQLMLAMAELISNAAEALSELQKKHLEENGDTPFAVPPVVIRCNERDEAAVIEIASRSAQSCPFELDTLFDPMVTQYAEKKRIGLGLTVCQAIVERFGGSIEVEEERCEHGCIFMTRLNLPLHPPQGTGEQGDAA